MLSQMCLMLYTFASFARELMNVHPLFVPSLNCAHTAAHATGHSGGSKLLGELGPGHDALWHEELVTKRQGCAKTGYCSEPVADEAIVPAASPIILIPSRCFTYGSV